MTSEPLLHTTTERHMHGYNEWRPECSCGWVGSYLHKKDDARREAMRHVADAVGECECYHDCNADSHSGAWHTHEGEPCPIHPDAAMVG